MRLSTSLIPVLPFLSLLHADTVRPSPKRGLVHIPNPDHPSDDFIWTTPPSDLTWYYNYQSTPSDTLASSNLQFVPMLWGAPASTTDNSFLTTVTSLINSGMNISYVMSFNEPEGSRKTGGSGITPELAASSWIRVIEPLRKLGVKLVAPATTGGPDGFPWLKAFFEACDGGCTVDVMPVHWYGSFEGLANHLGEKRGTYVFYFLSLVSPLSLLSCYPFTTALS